MTMRAWQLEQQTGLDALKLVERPAPAIGDGDLLVRLTAPGVVAFDDAIIHDQNEADFPKAVLPIQPGNQGAGIVEDPGRTSFRRGQRVMFGHFPYGFVRPGSWAELVSVDATHAWSIPDEVSDGAASQAVVAYPTAYLALREAGFRPGQSILVTAVGGSVGNAAVQWARALGASRVISTAGSSAKAQAAKVVGFDDVIDLSRESMIEGVYARNQGQGVDIVIESVGGPLTAAAVQCVCRHGVVITIGFSAGRQSTIVLADLILRRGRLQGFGVYSSSQEEWREAHTRFVQLVRAGSIRPLHARSFPFEKAPQALRHLIEDRPFGAVSLEF